MLWDKYNLAGGEGTQLIKKSWENLNAGGGAITKLGNGKYKTPIEQLIMDADTETLWYIEKLKDSHWNKNVYYDLWILDTNP